MTRSVLHLKAQYFFSFAVMGSLLPFLPVYLQGCGLGLDQIGYVGAVASIAVLLTPVSATLLADTGIGGRRLLAVVFAVSAGALAAMAFAQGFTTILVLYAVYSLTFAATTSLQDGLNFVAQQQQLASHLPIVPYHRVRVWGTVGFIVPSLLLFGLLHGGHSIDLIMASAAGFCLAGLLNTFGLPQAAAAVPQTENHGRPATMARDRRRLPTAAAAKAIAEPHILVFCLAMFLVHMATAAYYMFYPVYLKLHVGLADHWLGLVANLGVAIEIFFMLGFGRLVERLGLKRLMVVGVVAMSLRLMLLAASDTIAVAVGSQLLHGLMVLVVHVAPPIFLNRHAQDDYRNSIQGLYVMAVYGTGRIIGHAVAGHVAVISIPAVFGGAAGLCAVAAALFVFAFHDNAKPVRSQTNAPPT